MTPLQVTVRSQPKIYNAGTTLTFLKDIKKQIN